ncbi:helix-turn-helix domain-containing protein [Methylobacterium sp. NEAU K]|uniref:helix-turn-helix domain-containing protein n=1 Tax=Methylobacterium sp. NEAU K TaxID=3064946 RepID=UPI00351DE5A0
MLGSARLYTALTVRSDLGSTALAMRFFQELIRVHRQLAPEAAGRMASIGVDLIVAAIAERLAQEVPRPLHGTVVVQRAKAHVEAHLSDPTLDPPRLAAAMGVSLRRLQELFHERGQHISDWIWQRRLEDAAKRLADPGCAHLPIGTLAYGSGFANQAHFSRRFKDRHGMTPREYRFAALVSVPSAAAG